MSRLRWEEDYKAPGADLHQYGMLEEAKEMMAETDNYNAQCIALWGFRDYITVVSKIFSQQYYYG